MYIKNTNDCSKQTLRLLRTLVVVVDHTSTVQVINASLSKINDTKVLWGFCINVNKQCVLMLDNNRQYYT